MTDQRRIRLLSSLLAACCLALAPAIFCMLFVSLPYEERHLGWATLFEVTVYAFAWIAAFRLRHFANHGGNVQGAQLGAALFGLVGLWSLWNLTDVLHTMGRAYLSWSSRFSLGLIGADLVFFAFLCALASWLLLHQTGSAQSLAATTPLPLHATARVFGGLLVANFIGGFFSDTRHVFEGFLNALGTLENNTGSFHLISLLFLAGGAALAAGASGPHARVICRGLGIIQGVFAVWLVYIGWSAVRLMMHYQESLFSAEMLWLASGISALAGCLLLPAVLVWFLGEELSQG